MGNLWKFLENEYAKEPTTFDTNTEINWSVVHGIMGQDEDILSDWEKQMLYPSEPEKKNKGGNGKRKFFLF